MQLIDCARAAGVTADTVRHYLRIGLLTAEGRTQGGYRTFSERSVARVRFVRSALSLGFSLRDVSELVAMSERGDLPCPRARTLLAERIEQQRERLDSAQALYRHMKAAVLDWGSLPDGVPDGHSVCGLIEGTPPAAGAFAKPRTNRRPQP
ncbi:MerR family transcriptional regulator [Cupriavidus pinatubonensis]|jgi:DNA-binding transcriptional MerR regulator|uniref:HTH merR-type domain-containing protein n=1 Tax=Cupriavidus pinatubonensis TaxID=248026 RepID=A0ABM8XUG9_9BURK|nr:MerR family transcriptional regulator [Cupriavidus pinatubonensis]CAG9184020.1 hypothetical protein LMG23994_05289 [Cupriavidus pinatubonensis]